MLSVVEKNVMFLKGNNATLPIVSMEDVMCREIIGTITGRSGEPEVGCRCHLLMDKAN